MRVLCMRLHICRLYIYIYIKFWGLFAPSTSVNSQQRLHEGVVLLPNGTIVPC